EKFNDAGKWYSVKPAYYPRLLRRTPAEQVAGQVAGTVRKIEEDISGLPVSRVTVMDYEGFCSEPHLTLDKCETLMKFRRPDRMQKLEVLRFQVNNRVLVDQETAAGIKAALSEYN
ncbi:MAG: hypothetical protein KFF73_10240, partial [Cyclobacteriaceae bacterium]|nr:hypothetical protein [Cyclobacteriaceae bacterium]